MQIYKRLNSYYTYALSEILSKASLTVITIGSVSFLDPSDYTKMMLTLAWIGMLLPLFVFSVDVTIVRYIKDRNASHEMVALLLQTHFNIIVILFVLSFTGLIAYSWYTRLFDFIEINLVLISVSISGLYAVRLRMLLFNLAFFKASVLTLLPNVMLLVGCISLFLFGIIEWQERIIFPAVGFCLAIYLSRYYHFSSVSDVRLMHYDMIFQAAKWLTPQMLFNALYIYGDRIIASHYLTEIETTYLLLVAQCAFMLSFINRTVNTFWQTKVFNNDGQETSNFVKILGFALVMYLICFVLATSYFYMVFPAAFRNLTLAYCVYSFGFFLQLYYHLSNVFLLWRKHYQEQFLIAFFSGVVAIISGFAFYERLSWEHFGLVFCLTTLVQFLAINFLIYRKNGIAFTLARRSLMFGAGILLYGFCVYSISQLTS